MAATGTAVVYNIPTETTVTSSGIWASGICIIESVDHSHEADVVPLKNSMGVTIGFNSTDPRKKLTIKFMPSGATVDAAKAACEFPASPALVLIENFHSNTPDKVGVNGEWVYEQGATVSFTADGKGAVYTLPLTQYSTASSTLTAAVI
jgi:hypothetical protein